MAVRWTPHPGLTRLLYAPTVAPITSTSANPPGVPPAMSAARDCSAVGRRDPARRSASCWTVDDSEPSAPSTVVDCTGPRLRVIRPGAISADVLRETCPGSDWRRVRRSMRICSSSVPGTPAAVRWRRRSRVEVADERGLSESRDCQRRHERGRGSARVRRRRARRPRAATRSHRPIGRGNSLRSSSMPPI